MRPAVDSNLANVPSFRAPPSDAALGENEARVLRAVEEYCAAIQAGQKPDRQEFLARHAEIAGPLTKCLDGVEFVYTAAPELSQWGRGTIQPARPMMCSRRRRSATIKWCVKSAAAAWGSSTKRCRSR